MAFGFRVTGDHGVTQIDSEYANFVMTQKGSVTLTSDALWGVSPVVSATIAVTAKSPMLALSCATPVTVQYATAIGSSWTFYVTAHTGTGGIGVNWWIFDDADEDAASPPAWGMRVRRSDGSVVWHSGQKVARIMPGLLGDSDAVTYTSGRTYAVCQVLKYNIFNSTFIGGTDWRNQNIYGQAKVVSNVVTTSTEIYENYITTTDQGSYAGPSGIYLVVDVTGY